MSMTMEMGTPTSSSAVEQGAPTGPIELRPLATEAEFAACVQMQQEIWGDTYGELVPPIILQIVQKVGGVAVGAFTDDGELHGFVFGITGVQGGRLVHWSHILAVSPELRNSGLGRRLKEHQRELVRPLGVESIFWTFDPLVAKNAHLNLNRLRVRVVEYVIEMYGSTGSSLHALGTDRLVVDWRIGDGASEAGERGGPIPDGEGGPGPVVNLTTSGIPLDPEVPLPAEPRVRIAIPAELETLVRTDLDLARRWQASVRRAFLHYLDAGYEVMTFERALDEGLSFYHLEATLSGASPGDDVLD